MGHWLKLGISTALLALLAMGCGSEAESFRIALQPAQEGLAFFWASEVTYEIRRDSLGTVEQGDFELTHADIGPVTQRWERITTLPSGDDYWIDVSASDRASRCSGTAAFSVPPDRLAVFLVCGEPPALFYDTEIPEGTVFILGTVEEKDALR